MWLRLKMIAFSHFSDTFDNFSLIIKDRIYSSRTQFLSWQAIGPLCHRLNPVLISCISGIVSALAELSLVSENIWQVHAKIQSFISQPLTTVMDWWGVFASFQKQKTNNPKSEKRNNANRIALKKIWILLRQIDFGSQKCPKHFVRSVHWMMRGVG